MDPEETFFLRAEHIIMLVILCLRQGFAEVAIVHGAGDVAVSFKCHCRTKSLMCGVTRVPAKGVPRASGTIVTPSVSVFEELHVLLLSQDSGSGF